jgi:hypothetical protein
MHQLHPRLALFLFVIVIIAGPAAAHEPFALMRSLFDPGTNAQTTARQGSSAAIDGNRVVIGVPFDQAGGSGAGSVKVYDATTGLLLYTLLNPYPSLGEFFGRSVAISGDRVVIGADWDKGGTNVAGSAVGGAYVYELAGPTPTVPVMALTNPSPASTGVADVFGFSVAISGNRVVIGAPGEDIDGIDTGIAYVYDLAGETPLVPQFVLRNPTPATNEGFGYAVAISSARVVVSAPFDGVGATYAGSTYVFDLNGATPTAPITTLNNPDPGVSDQFGFSVAISGSRVVVGANQDDIGATDAGNAYVYDLTSATPHIPVLTLGSSAAITGDNFGYAVAISGGRVLIGAIYDDRSGVTNAGHAYVFDLASPTPTFPVVFLYNPSPAVGDNFGYAVAISGDRLVVGAPYDDTGAIDAGSGYLYDVSGATPAIPTATLAHPSPAATDRFGYAVAVSGTRMVVGAIRDDTGATDAGRVYVYDLAGANPNAPLLTLNNPAPQNNDLLGWSVGISGTHIVVGVPGKDFQTNNSGFVYVYNLADGTPTIPIFGVTNPTPAASDQFGIAVAIDGTRLVVGTPFDDTGATNAGSAYVYQLTGIGPRVPIATLTNPIPAVNDRFGAAVAISGSRVVIGAYKDDTGWPDAGSAYIYDLNSANARVPVHTLNKPSTSYNDTAHFGYSVAIAATRVVVSRGGSVSGLVWRRKCLCVRSRQRVANRTCGDVERPGFK